MSATAPSSAPAFRSHAPGEPLTITAGPARIALAHQGHAVLGIGPVTIAGVPVRNPHRIWRPVLATSCGIHYGSFIPLGVARRSDGSVAIRFGAIGTPTAVRDETDEYLQTLIDLTGPDRPVEDALTLELKPSELTLAGRQYEGFAYRYRFASEAGRTVWRLFDHATWEIGGALAGNELRLQGQCNPPVTPLSRETYFTTACNYYGAEMTPVLGEPKRVSMQRLSRIGTLQSFDMLIHEAGILLGLFEPVQEVMSIVHTTPGEDYLHIVDELRAPASDDWTSPWKHILLCPAEQPLAEHERCNAWSAAIDHVYALERRRVGVKGSPVQPRMWTPQLRDDWGTLGGVRIERKRFLYHMAEHILPRWADMGVREICTHSLWTSDYTVDRHTTRQAKCGLHGDLTVASICAVREHVIDPLWGGIEALAHFTDKAHRLGMKVQCWWASHLSPRAPIYQERPDFRCIGPDGRASSGGFAFNTLVTMDLNNPDCWQWNYEHIKAVHEQAGIDGLWHDSYGNMTFLPVSHADPQRRGQQEPFTRLLAAWQALGMDTWGVEGMGPYGFGHFGMALRASERENWQHSLAWWTGHADMIKGLNLGIHCPVWPDEAAARDFAFRALAHGGRFDFARHNDGILYWDGWLREQNRLHGRLLDAGVFTGRREVLPDGSGVLWHQPAEAGEHAGARTLFAFAPFMHRLPPGTTAVRITEAGEAGAIVTDQHLHAEPLYVYRLA